MEDRFGFLEKLLICILVLFLITILGIVIDPIQTV